MAGRITYVLPDKDTLIAQIKAAGSVKAHALSIGMDESTLRRRISKEGFSEEVQQALTKQALKADKTVETGRAGGKLLYDYPPADQLVEECVAAGSRSAYARQLGIPGATLKHHIERENLADRIDAGLLTYSLGERVSETERLRVENEELRRVVKKHRGGEVGQERVLLALEAGIKAAQVTYKATVPRQKKSHEPHTLALLFSDLHAGEVVSLRETNGLNEYDWDIMLKRLGALAESVRSHNEHYGNARARKLHIFSLGDQLSGVAHEELRESNDPPFAEAIVRLGEDIGEWIRTEFIGEFPDGIVMDCVVGNHPRFSQKPRAKVAYDNGDWITANVTRTYLAGHKNITVRAPMAAQTIVEICDRKVLLLHGDGVRTTMAGVPWGGIIRQSDRLRALFGLSDVNVEHVCCGHWHSPQIAEDWSILINGSVKGVDEYSLKRFGGGKPPSQLLAAFHPKRGLTGVHRIEL